MAKRVECGKARAIRPLVPGPNAAEKARVTNFARVRLEEVAHPGPVEGYHLGRAIWRALGARSVGAGERASQLGPGTASARTDPSRPPEVGVNPVGERPPAPTGPDFELIAESIPHIVWTASSDGATTYVNHQGTDYTGCPRDGDHDREWVDFVHPDDTGRAGQGWEQATRMATPYQFEYRLRRYDGVFRWHAFRVLPVRDERGQVTLWIGTATDIEDQKQLELSLRRSERQAVEAREILRSIDATPEVGFKFVDRDLRIVSMNTALARINGVSVEDCIGRTVPEVMPDFWPQLEDVYRRALGGEDVLNIDVSGQEEEGSGRTHHWLCTYYPVRVDGEIIGVGNAVVDITVRRDAEEALARNLAALVNTISTTVEYRDPYTAGHQRRVAELAGAIARELGLDADTIEGIETTASIHDIGKISVPAEILSKPGRLTVPEYELMKQHAEAGYNIIAGIDFPWPVAEMIRQHHERMDGSGYPRGLRGSEILLGARIIAVADVVEAMAAYRPYRAGQGIDTALSHIEECRGRFLDDEVVTACLRLFRSGRFYLRPVLAPSSLPWLALSSG